MLILRDIVKVFPGVKSPAVDNVNLTIAEGNCRPARVFRMWEIHNFKNG